MGKQRVSQHDDALVLIYVRSSDTARLFRASTAGTLVRAFDKSYLSIDVLRISITCCLTTTLADSCLSVCSVFLSQQSVDLEIVECLHAQDFLQVTNYALVRCALDVLAPSGVDLRSEVQRWKAQLSDAGQVFFRVAGGKPIFDGDGIDVTTTSNTSKLLSSLLKAATDASNQQQSSDTGKAKKNAKKKNAAQAALDAWDDELTAGAKRGSTTGTSDSGLDAEYLKTLEYGEIANIDVLCSLAPSSSSAEGLAPAPVLTIPDAHAPVLNSSNSSSVQLHGDILVLVSVQSTVAQVLSAVRERLSEQVRLPCVTEGCVD